MKLKMKISPIESDEELERFHEKFVNYNSKMMDEAIPKLREMKFESVQQAVSVLCLVLRSHASAFTVHKRRSRETCEGTVTVLQCHTKNNHKQKENKGNASVEVVPSTQKLDRCEWSATILTNKEHSQFTEIDSFLKHRKECFKKFSRYIPEEVSFQEGIPTNQRILVMSLLHQDIVLSETFIKRKYRMNLAISPLKMWQRTSCKF